MGRGGGGWKAVSGGWKGLECGFGGVVIGGGWGVVVGAILEYWTSLSGCSPSLLSSSLLLPFLLPILFSP